MRKTVIAVIGSILLASAPAFAQPQSDGSEKEAQQKEQANLVGEGIAELRAHRPAEAIERFDKVIAWYEKSYAGEKRRIYCAGSGPESLAYLLTAASEKRASVVLDLNWCTAIFLKGFALIDLNRHHEAGSLLGLAVEMAPSNSQFLAELAEFKKGERDWTAAFDLFERSATAADLADKADQPQLLGRAWRGMGFVQIELGQLDRAEAIFRKCLELDPNDQGAQTELQYIKDLRKQQRRKS